MRLLEKKGNEQEQVLPFDCNRDMRRLTGFNERYKDVKNRISFVQGDFGSLKLVLALFEHKPKSVFHLGALLSAPEHGPGQGHRSEHHCIIRLVHRRRPEGQE
ncbi:hypothetical protein [Bradyrhizobium sp. CCBAU 53380]|uniref:hypothetical protein n=1 Tax=Bradyrhizobium sp. CCBAU 53380 TaxID=1325117 RepID=UPI00230463DA|nr:hypothetical protein [Bradyrhizobium sp. CCBAU 53380]